MVVVGHRGCALLEPENTLRGFRRAFELGCDYVETDVRFTRDGALILMHDERVDRTTSGTGRVCDLTLREIQALDAGKGEQAPTFLELLHILPDPVQLLCELKGEGVESAAVAAVREAGVQERVVFTCFHLDRIRAVKAIDASLRTGAIFSEPSPGWATIAASAGAEGVGIHFRHHTRELIEEAHRHGLIIRAWNPDTVADIQRTIDLGPDGISSNRPDLVLQLLGRA